MSAGLPPPSPTSTPRALAAPTVARGPVLPPSPVVTAPRPIPIAPPAMPTVPAPHSGVAPGTAFRGESFVVGPDPFAPRRRRGRRVLLLVAVLAVVGIGIAALAMMRSEPSYSLAAAAQRTADAPTMAFEMTISLDSADVTSMEGAIDYGDQLMTMSMDMGAMLDVADGSMDMILDIGGGSVYLSGSMFPPEMLGSADWVSMDLAEMAEISGQSVEEFRDQFAMDPGASAGLFLDDGNLGEVTEIGVEDVDGEQMMHYQVSVALADALAATPQAQQQFDELAALDTELPETIVYDVWVAEGNEMRRLVFEMPVMGQTMRSQLDFRSIGEPLDVAIPSGSQVIDLSDVLGS